MPELVIFDLDGTLVDSKRDLALSVNLTLESFSFPRREPDVIYGFIGGGVHNLIRRSLPDGREDLVERGVEAFWDIYKGHVLDTTKPYPGVSEMLLSLDGRVKMALVTNKPFAHTELILGGLDMMRHFTSVQGWRLGVAVKPDPEMVLAALAETGVPGERAVMVGDGTTDVLAAKAAGVRACGVGYGYGSRERLIAAGADCFAERVEDIVGVLG